MSYKAYVFSNFYVSTALGTGVGQGGKRGSKEPHGGQCAKLSGKIQY